MNSRSATELRAQRRSMAGRMVRSLVRNMSALGLVCFLLGFGMYLSASMQKTMSDARDLAQECLDEIAQEVDPAEYTLRVRDIALSLNGAEMDESYYAHFEGIMEEPGYAHMMDELLYWRESDMSDFFLAVPDAEHGKLIFVADTDMRAGHTYPVGRQRDIPGWVQRYFFGRNGGTFPRMFYYLPNRGVICVSGAYVRQGDPSAGFLFVMVRAEDVLNGIRRYVLQYVLVMLVAIAVSALLATRRTKRTLIRPLNAVGEAVQDYLADKRSGAAAKEHFTQLDIHTGDELETLSSMLADMERELAEHEADLTRATAEKERINTELSLASRIQVAMLPHEFPPFPQRREFDLYAVMDPAKEVGGDFYDFFLVDDDHLCMVIADVSGKGVPAALFMMATKIMLANNAMMGKGPAEILRDTNEAVCLNNQEEMFLTVWLGVLQISTGRLIAANAGHEYPAIRRAGGAFELFKDRHGFVIGGMEGVKYREYELTLTPGDRLFVYTDGVPEATDARNALFGTQRMTDALNRDPAASPEGVLMNVRAAVDDFVKDAPQFDDLTMLCMAYYGNDTDVKMKSGEGD